jgi:hypothetical protein
MATDTDTAVVVAYMVLFFMQQYLLNTQGVERAPALFDDRLKWHRIIEKHGSRSSVKRHLRMSLDSFNQLFSYIRPALEVDVTQSSRRGGAILPEI